MSKYSIGQMNQLGNALEKAGFTSDDITKLMTIKLEVVKKILYDELIVREPVFKWREEYGAIFLKVISNGLTGPKWIKCLEKNGLNIGKCAKSVLLSNDFKPTNGVTYEIIILKGMLFENKDRNTSKIRDEADKRNFTKPSAEAACLIGENLPGEGLEAMGIDRIIVMHEPIKDYTGNPTLLSVSRHNNDRYLNLSALYGNPNKNWSYKYGFAFVVSKSNA